MKRLRWVRCLSVAAVMVISPRVGTGLTPQAAVARINKCRSCDAALNELHRQQHGSQPQRSSLHAYTAAVTVCGRAGSWECALQLSERVPAPDVVLFHATLGALARSGRSVEAEDLLRRMRRGGVPIDGVSLNTALSSGVNERWI